MEGLGRRIRSARVSKGLSLTEVSRGACTRAHLGAIELGKARPSPELLVHLSRVLDLSLRDLAIEYTSARTNPKGILTLSRALRGGGTPEVSLLLLDSLCRQRKDALTDPSFHLELGRTYSDLQRYSDAQRAFATAADQANRHNKWAVMAEALFHLGIVCCYLGEYKDALENLSRSIKSAPHSTDSDKTLLAKHCLASCFLRVGMHKRAVDLYTEVCSESKSAMYGSTPLSALAYLGLGIAHRNRQEYHQALQANSMALTVLKSSAASAECLGSVFNNYAVYFLDVGEPDRAEPHLLEILDNALRETSNSAFLTLTEFARLRIYRHQSAAARTIAERALRLAQRRGHVFEQGRLHTLLAALSPEEAEEHKAAVFQLGKQLTMAEERIYFYSDTGRLLRNTEFESVGRDFLDEAIRESENLSTLGKT